MLYTVLHVSIKIVSLTNVNLVNLRLCFIEVYKIDCRSAPATGPKRPSVAILTFVYKSRLDRQTDQTPNQAKIK